MVVIPTVTTINVKKSLIWSSIKKLLQPPCIVFKYTTKGRLPSIINKILIHSMLAELKLPKELSCVENPPVEMVVIAWDTESNLDMPAIK